MLRIPALVASVLGATVVALSLLWYQMSLETSQAIQTTRIGFLEFVAYVTLGLVIAGLLITFVAITHALRAIGSHANTLGSSTVSRLSKALSDRRSLRIFSLCAISYGVLFSVVSSTLVFQPGMVFSNVYGVEVPSIIPVVCCGAFGQMPQFVVYVTQQFAILLVPTNIILLFVVSWLVGLNAAAVNYAYSSPPLMSGRRWMGGLGAAVGLFTACPSCAGFLLLSVIGLSGAASVALTLASLQGVFVLIGIPILVSALFLNTRRVPMICSLDTNSLTGSR